MVRMSPEQASRGSEERGWEQRGGHKEMGNRLSIEAILCGNFSRCIAENEQFTRQAIIETTRRRRTL